MIIRKQKIQLGIFIFSTLLMSFLLASEVQAAGSATVSWTPPTTDEGGGSLTGLAGYKVFYKTSSNWLGILTTCLVGGNYGAGSEIDVSGGAETSYHFNNTLTPGQTYYFAVAAYDDAETPNVSKCATTAGALREVSKLVSYSGDINASPDHIVNINDFTILADYYHQAVCGPDNKADINQDCHVDMNDFTILADDYGKSF
jgi:hypothetical protein